MNQQATQGDTAQTREMLTRHLECFAKLDLAGTMTDYAQDSRLFSPAGAVHGTEPIRKATDCRYPQQTRIVTI